ncbi:hypothetical protein PG985_003646 [Apiospora marii]
MHTQQILFLLAAAGTACIEAHPSSPAPRQVADDGSSVCSTTTLMAGLQETRTNLDEIDDVTTRGTAIEGINLASNAINSIAVAVFVGDIAPANARQITEGGLNITQAALDGGDK